MTLWNKIQALGGGAILINALLWVGFPIRIEAIAQDGIVQWMSAALYTAGIAAIATPLAVTCMQRFAPVLLPVLAFVGFVVMLVAFHLGDSPMLSVLGTIPLMVIATGSATGGLTLILAGVWRGHWFIYPRTLHEEEARDSIAPP